MNSHAELKREYKNRPKNMGVFQIKNLVNGKIYIGSTFNLDGMRNRFAIGIKYGWYSNGNTELLNEMKTFGAEKFVFEVLDYLKPVEDPLYDYQEDLKTLETVWMDKLQPYGEKGYHKKRKNL